jgi:hypothetical protein
MRTTGQETGLVEMVNEKPSTKVTRERMWARQILAIAILTACTAAEGFDVYVPEIYAGDHIAMAAPRRVAWLPGSASVRRAWP